MGVKDGGSGRRHDQTRGSGVNQEIFSPNKLRAGHEDGLGEDSTSLHRKFLFFDSKNFGVSASL